MKRASIGTPARALAKWLCFAIAVAGMWVALRPSNPPLGPGSTDAPNCSWCGKEFHCDFEGMMHTHCRCRDCRLGMRPNPEAAKYFAKE